jgi:hypothetical protein
VAAPMPVDAPVMSTRGMGATLSNDRASVARPRAGT